MVLVIDFLYYLCYNVSMKLRPSLAELYDRHPLAEGGDGWYAPISLEQSITAAGDLHNSPDPFGYLESIRDADREVAAGVVGAINSLPADVVVGELGREIALWTAFSSHMAYQRKPLGDQLSIQFGDDTKDMEIARNWNWDKYRSFEPTDILAVYSLMIAVKRQALDAIDLPEILQHSARAGITLSQKRLADYSLSPLECKYNTYYPGGRIKQWDKPDLVRKIDYMGWLDAPIGFALNYRGDPNAIGAMAPAGGDSLMLHQIQGVRPRRIDPTKSEHSNDFYTGEKGGSRGLMPLDWQRVIITVNERIARHLGYASVAVQSGQNNNWVRPYLVSDLNPHITEEFAAKAYDAPARRLGYHQSSDKPHDWYKTLTDTTD